MASVEALDGPRAKVMTFCAEDGCTAEVEGGRCDRHRRRVQRPSGAYDRHWRIRRAAYLKKHPRCERCGAGAMEVHHIDGLGPAGSNADSNLEALCKSCHSSITARTMWEARRP